MKLLLHKSNEQPVMVTVTEINETDDMVTVRYEDGTIKTLLSDNDSKTLYDLESHNIIPYKFSVINDYDFYNAISDPNLHESTELIVWNMIMGSPPPCSNCTSCIMEQIRVLESHLRNVPERIDCATAAIFISEIMLPRIYQRLRTNVYDVINLLLGGNDQGVIDQSMYDGGNVRHAASKNTVDKLEKFVKQYNENHHSDDASCAFCLDTFKEITESQHGISPMVITCPGCSSSFCAGSTDKEKKECEDVCKGFLGGQMDVDHRCPMCRMSVKEWIEDDVPVKKNDETRVLITTNMLARGIDVQNVSLVLNYNLPSKKNSKKYYPKFPKKVPYKRIQQKSFHKKLHKRQFYGASRH